MSAAAHDHEAEQTAPMPIAESEVLPGISKAKALFLTAAGLSFLLSVSLWFAGSREQGIFVGLWVPSILSAGALLLARENHHE